MICPNCYKKHTPSARQDYSHLCFDCYFMDDQHKSTDSVDHPAGYTQGSIESWDYITDKKMNFLEGNIIKYVTRYRHKNGLEDLKKAKKYLDKLIETEYPDGE